MAGPIAYKPGDIVPSQQVPLRSRPDGVGASRVNGSPDLSTEPGATPKTGAPCDCNPCVVGSDGFVYCWDGNQVILNDYPKTGGPWIPAVTNNGGVVWINGAGL